MRHALILMVALAAGAAQAADSLPLAEMAKPGRLLMLRHALAPGTGDPPGFRLGDCSTQRNLDKAGRMQALRLGERLREAGLTQARVYSSQWCRCMETALLLGVGAPQELPALNSNYNRPEAREERIAALRAFISRLPADDPPVVLVTHQFTIAEFTGGGTVSGGGTVFELNGTGTPRLLGAIAGEGGT